LRQCALALTLAVAASSSAVEAKTILVIGTHPDDETLMSAGRSRTALTSGDTIKVVIVTNGDANGVSTGLNREAQAVGSAQALGLREQDVIFLGYPDGSMRDIYDSTSGTQVFTSLAGQTATYGNRGLGLMDYHRFLTGASASYSRNNVASDFQALLNNFRPDEIYTHSAFEGHTDHQAVALFVLEALASLRRSGSTQAIKLYQGVIWMPYPGGAPNPTWAWPEMTSSGWTPYAPFLPYAYPCSPGDCLDLTQWEPSRMQRFIQPPEMQRTDITTNMKAVSISQFGGTNPWYVSFARRDEMYWMTDFWRNVALTAQVTASSENSPGQAASRAVDAIIAGYPTEPTKEWVSNGEFGGAWLQLSWPSPVRIAQVNLYDRPDTTENILSGTLTFSDGSSLNVGALPTNGRVMPLTFAPKTVSWVVFTVNNAVGTATGLSEIQVLGVPATSTANNPPHFIQGPVPASDTIPASQSTNLSVVAHDIDGDAIQYQWSTEAGFIWGNGSSATFTPPAVSADTYVAITVQISDGRGGTASNSTFVKVTPAPTNNITVSPAAVFAGSSSQGTVTLPNAAPAGGTAIPLSSSNPAVAAPPASVTVPGGSTFASFNIATGGVSASTSVSIAAAFASGTRSAPLTVSPPSVSSLTTSPTNVLGGVTAQGTVTLPIAAGGQGALVQLSSNNPSLASVPANVTVAAGATTATFPIATSAVSSPIAVTISATYGTSASATLTVSPLALNAVLLNPSSIIGGSTSQGTVLMNGPVSGSTVVALASADSTVVSVPSSVTVPAGADRTTFVVSTGFVTSARSIAVTGTFAGASQSASLTVSPSAGNPNLLTSPEQIGAAPWELLGPITVTLNYAAAPDGSLSATRGVVTSSAGHALRQGPAVTAGTTYTFSFFAKNNGGTAASYSVWDDTHGANIVAPTSYFSQINGSTYTRVGVTLTAPTGTTRVFVYPLRDSGGPVDVLLWGAKLEIGSSMTGYQLPSSDSVSVSPSSVAGGSTAQGTVTLQIAAPAGGTTVPLSSSNPAVASVPANVTVPVGMTSATFPVTTSNVAAVTSVTLSAAIASGTRTTSLTVTPALAVSSLVLNPTSVVGGSSSQGTVTLNGTASGSGAVVNLSSSNPAATVPATVTVPSGSSSATFSIGTSAVQASTSSTISASYGGATGTATLTVLQPDLSTLALNPSSVVGGNPSTGTVTLRGPAPTGGVTVALSSNDTTTATVPASVTVPAGSPSATFTVSTTTVTATRTPVISSSLGSISRSATLTVTAGQPASNPNLLLSPEQIGAAPWGLLGAITVTTNFAAAPDGTIHASRAVVTSTAGHAVRQTVSVTPGQTYTLSFFAKNNGGTAASYSVWDDTHSANIVAPTSYFSQINGSTYTRLSVTFAVPAGSTSIGVYPLRDSGGPVDTLLWGAKLEVGSTMTAYP